MEVLDFSFDLNNRYTVWTGFLGGTFLMLSYFGTDQSQVQRYLSGKSLRESQLGLVFNGLLKVPMQFFILMVGVMVFVFYQFNNAPLNFNPAVKPVVENSLTYKVLEKEYEAIQKSKQLLLADGLQQEEVATFQELNAKDLKLKQEAKTVISSLDETIETNDKDYVFISFILNNLPKGIIGLLLAVILAAAMSSTASELNALASTTAIDLYRRNKQQYDEQHYVTASKWFTLLWGLLAIGVACVANLFDNLIQLVNIIGSIFYGNVLGIFLLAFFIKFVKGRAVFIAAIITQLIIFGVFYMDWLPYLWLNLVGCVLVMLFAIFIEMFSKNNNAAISS